MIRAALERRLLAVARPVLDRIDRAAASWLLSRRPVRRELLEDLLERLAARVPGAKLEMTVLE